VWRYGRELYQNHVLATCIIVYIRAVDYTWHFPMGAAVRRPAYRMYNLIGVYPWLSRMGGGRAALQSAHGTQWVRVAAHGSH
jgi:hypothetical protein